MNHTPPHILIVDDEALNLEIISEYLSEFDYRVSTAEDGAIAWAMLESNPTDFDVILLDRMMPNMNGMEVLEKIKQHPILQHCPVIFQTAKASTSDIAEGMNAGSYYYLTKPFEEQVLLSVTKTAVNDRLRYKEISDILDQTKLTLGLLNSADFEFKSLEEAKAISSLISNACPDPASVVMGLTELMINAIEHGNLAITYNEKSDLNNNGTWLKEVNKRLLLDKNINKFVAVSFQRHPGFIEISVTDQGEGFDSSSYMEFDPDRVMDNHGRGIAVANKLSFSSVEYKGKGNEVHARILLN
ncbi:MAG: response regulator [Methylococcales bacterium]|nr:response regulator [Methylococcales bacterium]